MKTKANSARSIDEYIALHPPQVQDLLQKIRIIIPNKAPQAIKYQISTFISYGNLVHFAA